MSQFPMVNNIDPVTPTAASLIGLTAGNLNQAADRQLQAGLAGQQAALAREQMASQEALTREELENRRTLTDMETQRYREYNQSRANEQAMGHQQAMERITHEDTLRQQNEERSIARTEKLLLERQQQLGAAWNALKEKRRASSAGQIELTDQHNRVLNETTAESRRLEIEIKKLAAANSTFEAARDGTLAEVVSKFKTWLSSNQETELSFAQRASNFFTLASTELTGSKLTDVARRRNPFITALVTMSSTAAAVTGLTPGADDKVSLDVAPGLTVSAGGRDSVVGLFQDQTEDRAAAVALGLTDAYIKDARFFDGQNAGAKNDAVGGWLKSLFALQSMSSLNLDDETVEQLKATAKTQLDKARQIGVTDTELNGILDGLMTGIEESSNQLKLEGTRREKMTEQQLTVVKRSMSLLSGLRETAEAADLVPSRLDADVLEQTIERTTAVVLRDSTPEEISSVLSELPPGLRTKVIKEIDFLRRSRETFTTTQGLAPEKAVARLSAIPEEQAALDARFAESQQTSGRGVAELQLGETDDLDGVTIGRLLSAGVIR